MVPRALVLPLLIVSLAALSACHRSAEGSEQQEWRSVLELKRRYVASSAAGGQKALAARQAWADAVAQFLARHPTHARARAVHSGLQLEFARDLSRAGRSDDAIRYYRAVVAADANAVEARRELAAALLAHRLDEDDLAAVKPGMSRDDVRTRFGNPRPGWTKTVVAGGRATECWYYPAASAGVAAIFFSDGKVFATEYPAAAAQAAGGAGK